MTMRVCAFIVLAFVLAPMPGHGTPSPLACAGGPVELQRLRDALQIARTHLLASKDNFGPARGRALQKSEEAIAEFDRLSGNAKVTPSEGTDKAQFLGTRYHPHMNRALSAWADAKGLLSNAHCAQVKELDALRLIVGQGISDIYTAFTYNPMGSGH